MNSSSLYRRHGWLLVPLSMLIIFTVLTVHVPLGLDDYVFKVEYLTANNGSSDFNLGALLRYEAAVRAVDNGRISNWLSPLSTTIQPLATMFPYLTAAMLTAVLIMAARWSCPGRWRSLTAMALMWLMMVVWLPWHNTIFLADYSLNYIWGAAVTLGFVSLMVLINRRGWHWWQLALMMPAAVVAGGWHEGFAIPACAGLLVLTFTAGCKDNAEVTTACGTAARPLRPPFRWSRCGWQWWLVGVVYGLSALAFALSPGMLNRAGREAGNGIMMPWFKILMVHFLFFATAGLFISMSTVRSGRRIIVRAWQLTWFKLAAVMAVTSMLFALVFVARPRTVFLPNLCCSIVLLNVFYLWLDRRSARWWMWIGRAAAAVWVLCMVQGGYAAYWQGKYYDESEAITAAVDRSATGTVFYDVIQPVELPLATMYMPPRANWLENIQYYGYRQLTGKPYTAVVPTDLRFARGGDAAGLIPGTMQLRNLNSSYYVDYCPQEDSMASLEYDITLADGSVHRLYTQFIPFISEPGDTLYYMIIPHRQLHHNQRRPGNVIRADKVGDWKIKE